MKKKPKLRFLLFVLLIAVFIFGFLQLRKRDQKPTSVLQTIKQKAVEKINQYSPVKIGRVVGKSSGKLPYAPVDQDKIATAVIGVGGGVIEAALPKGGRAYLVVPKGSVITGTARVSLLPYKEMPTGKRHGEVSNELGYGVQIDIDSPQISTDAYLVFDAKGEQERKFTGQTPRCNPNLTSFNPAICARRNKASQLVDKNATVVTPIHNPRFNDLIFTRNTIPTGVDGLLVTRITRGDVYVPQRLDKDLAKKYVEKTIGKYDNDPERLEAGALADAWDISLSNEKLDVLSNSFSGYETYQEGVKAIVLNRRYRKKAEDRLAVIRTRSPRDEDEQDRLDEERENLEDLISVYADNERSATRDFYEDVRADTRGVSDPESQEAAAGIGTLEEFGVEGAGGVIDEALNNLEDSFGSDKSNSETRVDSAEAGDLADDNFGDSGPSAQEVKNALEDALNDPNATAEEILDAWGTAQAYGVDDDEMDKKVIDRLRGDIEDAINNAGNFEDCMNGVALAQAVGLDDVSEKGLDKCGSLPKKKDCDLIKKTLKTYGINECK
ncbi:hypothetical protein HYT33_03445 [Candidatus Roizmanbacteria bacterium]|nr:hypothetical protein [Candidatus Roizmanbacteria bacterium]